MQPLTVAALRRRSIASSFRLFTKSQRAERGRTLRKRRMKGDLCCQTDKGSGREEVKFQECMKKRIECCFLSTLLQGLIV